MMTRYLGPAVAAAMLTLVSASTLLAKPPSDFECGDIAFYYYTSSSYGIFGDGTSVNPSDCKISSASTGLSGTTQSTIAGEISEWFSYSFGDVNDVKTEATEDESACEPTSGVAGSGPGPFAPFLNCRKGVLIFDTPTSNPFALGIKTGDGLFLYYFEPSMTWTGLGFDIPQNGKANSHSFLALDTPTQITPEPATLLLLLTGLTGLGIAARRRRNDRPEA